MSERRFGRNGGFAMMGFLVAWTGTTAFGAVFPPGTSILGLRNGQWALFISQAPSALPMEVALSFEARQFALCRSTSSAVVTTPDNTLVHLTLSPESTGQPKPLSSGAKRVIVQPAVRASDCKLFAVDFPNGSSKESDIVEVSADGRQVRTVISQPGAQYEPFVREQHIYYSSALCVMTCGRVIQEIWQHDLASGRSDQLTLLGALSREPTVTADGKWLYFSSNQRGNYHIWRMQLPRGTPEPVTNGDVSDTSPALSADGGLFFIRHTPDGKASVLKLVGSSQLEAIELPPGIVDVRELEIAQ